ncbi:hypothetical protein GCK32_008090 [Trichostrongylus colubriformis]|uniref:Uncharacterized protein n=1 Tax=Trichostrongylus colubriformis TaxID=6319 RepID=A0AAN8FLU4_TRICO
MIMNTPSRKPLVFEEIAEPLPTDVSKRKRASKISKGKKKEEKFRPFDIGIPGDEPAAAKASPERYQGIKAANKSTMKDLKAIFTMKSKEQVGTTGPVRLSTEVKKLRKRTKKGTRELSRETRTQATRTQATREAD